MSARWSRIHAVLGLVPGDLTYRNVCDAVAQSASEGDDLDFKRALPPRDDRKLREFAKDVAAMANTRGGLIIFGVVEEDECAVEVCGVPNSEAERQRLSSVAASRIHPMVSGLKIFALDGEAGEPGLLVVSVPGSPDAPHLIGSEGEIGVPFRDGSNTRWMRERDLERSYADRFARRVSSVNALREQRIDLTDQLDLDQGCWIIVTSRPTAPVPAIGLDPTPDDVRQVLTKTLGLSGAVSSGSDGKAPILRELNDGANNPRIGLRRWIVRSNHFGEPDERSRWVHVELHHDGSASFAACLQAWNSEQANNLIELHVRLVESAIIDAVTLATAHARSVGGDASVGIEVDLARRAEVALPMIIIDDRRVGGFVLANASIVPGSREIRRFKPVYTEVSVTDSVDGVRSAARQLCEDTLNQFGVQVSSMTAPAVRL